MTRAWVAGAALVTTLVGSTLAVGVVVASVDGGAVTAVVGAGGVVGVVTTVVATVVTVVGTAVVVGATVVGAGQAGPRDRVQEGPALLSCADPTTTAKERPTKQAIFAPIDEVKDDLFWFGVEIMLRS